VLVVTDQPPSGVGGQGRLAGAGKPEEHRHVVVGSDVRAAVHRQHLLLRQQVVEHREDRFLDLTGVGGAADEHQLARQIEQDEGLRVGAVDLGDRLEGGHVDDRELGHVRRQLLGRGLDKEVSGEERVPGADGDDPDR
jgi:hypothetical protein